MKRNVAHAEPLRTGLVSSIRPYAEVLLLVNADRLPGQPEATPEMLTEAHTVAG